MSHLLQLFLLCTVAAALADELQFEPELAGISGLRQYWDRPVMIAADGATRASDHGSFGSGPVADWSTDRPGAPVVDAVHRRLLVRFPTAAAELAAAVAKGQRIEKAELAFEFVDTEFFPMDYRLPSGMSFMGDIWVKNPPRWHVVAQPLRRAWHADPELGPTFNAAVNGRVYWGRFGARDESADRWPATFGPTEVSYEVTSSRMAITELVTSAQFGGSLGERLRRLSDNGLILRKWETYDARYNPGGYEYGGAPGHRGIRLQPPKLIVTLSPGQAELGVLPPPAAPADLPASGQPTAVVPAPEAYAAYLARFGVHQRPGMPDWQFARIQELIRLHDGPELRFPETYDDYLKWLDDYNTMPYRMFTGHHTPITACEMTVYGDAVPAPIYDHMKRYWDAWLMPGRPYYETAHNQFNIWTKPEHSYFARTGDWRGNHSFYRGSYTRFISTMNFNHNAALGALMGGALTNNAEALADGRFALETILLRLWAWYDGTTQESIDHYYLGLTLYGQKFFQDAAPTPAERLMGRSMLLKTTEELASCYHPALKRFIASSGRTGVAEMFCVNEGVNHIMHLVSQRGALHNIGNHDNLGCPLVGHDLPPDLVARAALLGDWLPLWMSRIVDDKPFPYEMTAAYRQWGGHLTQPIWKRTYMTRFTGLASRDITENETVPVMAQWRRTPGDRADLQDIGTLLARFGCNRTEFYDSLYHGTTTSNANGVVGIQGGAIAAMQHRSKLLLLGSPFGDLSFHGRPRPKQIHSIQTTIALANYQAEPAWQFYVDGQPLDIATLPVTLKQSNRLTIHDGESFLGIIPIPSTDLGRTAEVMITDGGEPVKLQGGGEAAPTLLINNYLYYDEATPFALETVGAERLAEAFGGFVIEVGDTSLFPDFAAFQQHLTAAQLRLSQSTDTTGNGTTKAASITYESGDDEMTCRFDPACESGQPGKRVPTGKRFLSREVNGAWPYLAEGMERDSTLGQQGRTGQLAKNGAALQHEPGRMAYLLTEPQSGNYVFANPLPDPQYFIAQAPGDMRIEADGRVSLLHLLVEAQAGRIEVHYGAQPGQDGPDMATALYVFGAPLHRAAVNGAAVELLTVGEARVIPLTTFEPSRYQAAVAARVRAFAETAGIPARLRVLAGQEPSILTEPRSGSYSFWRQWPQESPFEVTAPGVRLATDGSLALQRIIVSPAENRIVIDYAPYLQVKKADGSPIDNRAQALLVFGMQAPPEVVLHGKPCQATATQVTVAGEAAYIVPLFGSEPADISAGLEARYTAAMAALEQR